MGLPADINDRILAATVKAESASEILRRWANEGEGVFIDTEAGSIPSLAEWLRLNPGMLAATLETDLASLSNTAKGARKVGWFSSATGFVGRWLSDKLNDLEVSLDDYGVVGDGSDETLKIQRALAAAAGKKLKGKPGKTYFVTDELLVPSGTIVDFCGSTLIYSINTNGKNCIRFQNHKQGALWNVTIRPSGVTLGDHGGSRMPVCIGEYGNTFGNTPNRSIVLANVTVEGGFSGMNAFALFGDVADVMMINCSVIGSVTYGSAGIGILAHWSANNTGAPTTTYHPHNIAIVNPRFESVSLGAVQDQPSAIFLSGAYNVLVDNMDANDINTGVFVYPGDFGFTYAPAAQGTRVRGIHIRNASMQAVRRHGVTVLGQANGAGPNLYMGVTVENSRTSGGLIGLRTYRCAGGVVFCGCAPTLAGAGVRIEESSGVKLYDSDVFANSGLGVYLPSSSQCQVVGNWIHGNNTSGLTNQLGSAVYLDGTCKSNQFSLNVIGAEVATEYYGLRINGASVTNTLVSDNEFLNFTSGVALQNHSDGIAVRTIARGNQYTGSSLTAFVGGGTTFDVDAWGRHFFFSSAAPSTGTHKVGDRARPFTPAVGSPKGWVCTVAGSPGTWVSEGNL